MLLTKFSGEIAEEYLQSILRSEDTRISSDENGALLLLFGNENTPRAPRPDFIIMDGDLPNSVGILEKIRNDPKWGIIPVTVLSSDDDVGRFYDAHASAVVLKPKEPGKLRDVVDSIYKFWSLTAVWGRIEIRY